MKGAGGASCPLRPSVLAAGDLIIADSKLFLQVGAMRTTLTLLALAMVSGCGGGGASSQAERKAAPPEIVDAVTNWSKCRASKLSVLLETDRRDEDVVDEAFGRCVAFEHATEDLWEKHYGPNSASQVQKLKSRWREDAIANVRQVRAGLPPSGAPEKNWGVCLGEKIPNPVPTNMTPESVVDAAMAACAPEMYRVQADYAQRYGAAEAAAYVEQIRLHLRKLALEMAEERRSSH